MSKPKYDSTVARIAGNVLSGLQRGRYHNPDDTEIVKWAVSIARMVVDEVKRTQPVEPE